LSPRIVGNSQANKHRKQGKEAKATIIIRNFVKVKARTHCSQLVAIVALISLKLVTFFSSKQHARASSRQKESSYRVTNYSWMQRGKNLAFHISDLIYLIWFFLPFIFPSCLRCWFVTCFRWRSLPLRRNTEYGTPVLRFFLVLPDLTKYHSELPKMGAPHGSAGKMAK